MSVKRSPASVLVVDDDPGILRAAQRVLGRRFSVTIAASPREAMERLHVAEPDVAILDVLMPQMNGFDLMRKMAAERPGLDFLLMTGNVIEADESLVRAIQGGAFYFVQKPFDGRVLRALVNRCLELRELRHERQRYTRHLEEELAQAKRFQESLLPPATNTIAGVSIAAAYQACESLAGDLYDYAEVNGDRVALLLADVSGHGAMAAMLTGIVKSAFHGARAEEYEPLAVVERLAAAMRSFEAHRFVTVVAARIDVATGNLTYVSAGHPPAYVGRAGQEPRSLDSTGPLISPSIPDSLQWQQSETEFNAGERLLLYSDGLTEARGCERDEFFGYDRLKESFTHSRPGAGWLVHDVLDHVQRYVARRPLEDDLTLLVAERVE